MLVWLFLFLSSSGLTAKAFDTKLLNINELINHPTIIENSCAQPVLPESVLCGQTFDEFCEGENDPGKITDSDIGALVDASLDKKITSSPILSGSNSVTRSKREFIESEKIIYEKLSVLGITKQDFSTRFELIKSQIIKTLKSSPSFAAKKLNGESLLDADIKALTATKPLTASDVMKMSDAQFKSYSEICGSKGLNVNALNDQQGHIVVCPGFTLTLLQAGSLDTMDFVIAHELSHTIDPTASLSDFRNIENPNLDAFAPYLSCVENHHSDYFHDLTATKHRDLQLKAAFSKCASVLKRIDALDPEAQLVSDQDLAYWNMNRDAAVDSIRESLGNGFNNVTSHARELSADMMGTLISSKLLQMNVARSTQSIRNQLSFLCDKPDSMKIKVIHDCFQDYKSETGLPPPTEDTTDDGLHPGESYRFKAYMSSPGVRAALGCTKSTKPNNSLPKACFLEGVPQEPVDQKLRHRKKPVSGKPSQTPMGFN
jgi:hypothetical protein